MFSRRISFMLTWTLLLLLATTSLYAEVPQLVNYQGRLTDTNGDPMPDTTIDITFSIYRSDGIQVWTSGPQPVALTNGLFSYVLGSNVALPLDVMSTSFDRLLGIKVGDDPEMTPREQLVCVPYAYKVATVNGATGGTITGSVEVTEDIRSQDHGFEFFYPSNILFESDNQQADDFMIGSTFSFDADQGVLRLGTAGAGFEFPATDGAAGQVLSSDGGGQLSWTDVSSGSRWSVTDSVLYTNDNWGIARGNAGNKVLGNYSFTFVNLGISCTTGVGHESRTYCTISGGAGNAASGRASTIGGGINNKAAGEWGTIGGGENNSIGLGLYSTIGGGSSNSAFGRHNTIGGGGGNDTYFDYATISGGSNNLAVGVSSTIGGGELNEVNGDYGTICGGADNTVQSGATICGGSYNTATGNGSIVGAGFFNLAEGTTSTVGGGLYSIARGDYSVIAGGGGPTPADSNVASGNQSSIGGGAGNSTGGSYATVGGGGYNTATGVAATVPGGYESAARGYLSFAAGNRARANHGGSVVLVANSAGVSSDSVRSGGDEQMVLRADGGLYLTNTSELAPYDATKLITTRGGAYLSGNGTTWTNSSDKNQKENFTTVDGKDILKRLEQLEISQWNYKTEDENVKHIGPVAQDLHALFGVGADDKSISTVDPAGIALAAIKELNEKTKEAGKNAARIEELECELIEMKSLLEELLAQRK